MMSVQRSIKVDSLSHAQISELIEHTKYASQAIRKVVPHVFLDKVDKSPANMPKD